MKCLDIQVIIKNYASVINLTGSLASDKRRLQASVHLVRATSNEDLQKEKNVLDGLLEVMSRNKLQAASLKLQAPSIKAQASSPKRQAP